MPTYAPITGRITYPGSDTGLKGLVTAVPLVRESGLQLDGRLSQGVISKPTDASGNLPTGAGALRIPVVEGLSEALVWKLVFEPLEPLGRADINRGLRPWVFYLGPITAAADVADLAQTDLASLLSTFPIGLVSQLLDARTDAFGFAGQAEAAAAAAVDISNISTSHDVVSALVKNTAGAGPKTAGALLASQGEQLANPGSPARLAADQVYADRTVLPLTEARLAGQQRARLAQVAQGASIGAWSGTGQTNDGTNPVVGYKTIYPGGTEVSAVLDPYGARTLNPLLTYAGGAVVVRGTNYPDNMVTKAAGLSFDGAELMPRIFFVIENAAGFELLIFSRGADQTRTRVAVDGAWIASQPVDGPVNDGQPRTLPVALPDTGRHVVMIETSGYTASFAGIRVPAGAKVTKHQAPLGPRWIIPGDSEVEGANGVPGRLHNPFGYAAETARLMGVIDYWQSGIGSTGWVATAGGTRPSIRDRFHADVTLRAPDVVVMPMSENDSGFTKAAIKTNVLWCIDDLLATRPDCLIIVVANMQPQSGAGLTAVRDAGREAAAERGLFFIDTSAFLTGTGHVGAPAGDGNKDVYTSADAQHLSDAGHQAYARLLAAAITTGLSPAGKP